MSTLTCLAVLICSAAWLAGVLTFFGIYLVWQDQWHIKKENPIVSLLRRLAVLSSSWIGVGMAIGRIGWDTTQLRMANYRQHPPYQVKVPAGQLIAIWVDGAWKTDCDQTADRQYVVPLQRESEPKRLPGYAHTTVSDAERQVWGYYALYEHTEAKS